MVTNGDPRPPIPELRGARVDGHEVNQAHPFAFRPWNALPRFPSTPLSIGSKNSGDKQPKSSLSD